MLFANVLLLLASPPTLLSEQHLSLHLTLSLRLYIHHQPVRRWRIYIFPSFTYPPTHCIHVFKCIYHTHIRTHASIRASPPLGESTADGHMLLLCWLMKGELELDTCTESGLQKCDPAALPQEFKWSFSFCCSQEILNRGTCGHWGVLACYWIWGSEKKNGLSKAVFCPTSLQKGPAFHSLPSLISLLTVIVSLLQILLFTPQVTFTAGHTELGLR